MFPNAFNFRHVLSISIGSGCTKEISRETLRVQSELWVLVSVCNISAQAPRVSDAGTELHRQLGGS